MAIRTAVNRALTAITALPTAAALANGNLTLLTTATASSSATLDFTSSIDSTYDSYVFKFYDIHAATDDVFFTFNGRDGGTAYDATKTSTAFMAYHNEAGNDQAVSYITGSDLAQSTAFQNLMGDSLGIGNDESAAGELILFSPANTTFVKHFMTRSNHLQESDYTMNSYVAGYFNVTAAIDGIQFKMSSGNIDAGVIKMYGVGDKQ
jgi:hypothetical protein